MKYQNILGSFGGLVIAAAIKIIPAEINPFIVILALQGVYKPQMCLQAISMPSSPLSDLQFACAPLSNANDLINISTFIMFAALVIIGFGVGQLMKNK